METESLTLKAEPWQLTVAESLVVYSDPKEWYYRFRMPHMPKPPELVAAEEKLHSLWEKAHSYGMFERRELRSTKKVAVKALADYEKYREMVRSLADEWRQRIDTHSHRHHLCVAEALAEGKPVPVAVLAEYPDLLP